MVEYKPLSDARPPGPAHTEAVPNYESEPTPSYFEKTYTYDKYMSDVPRLSGTLTPSNSSQVDILSTFAESNSHQTFEEHRLQSATGFGAGLICLGAETLVGYPLIVLRRQCQVNASCKARDLSPLLMLKAIIQIQQRQGVAALWKGFTCHMMLEGLTLTTDSLVSHITELPKELPNISEGVARYVGYFTLKTVSTIMTLPVFSAVLLDTVQSESARFESATTVSCLKDAIWRVLGSNSTHQYRILVPFHHLILPAVAYTILWDIIGQIVHSSVLKLCKLKQGKQADKIPVKPYSKSSLLDNVWPELLAGTIHCFAADITLLPLEIVMHRLHLQGTRAIVDNVVDPKSVIAIPYQAGYTTLIQCVECLVETEGTSSFWKGLSALLLQYTLRFGVVHAAKLLLKFIHKYRNHPSADHNDSLSVNLEK